MIGEKLEKREFWEKVTEAKILKGWYSRKWEDKPGGFMFLSRGNAEEFQKQEFPDSTETTPGIVQRED